jgi:O-acetyl-ADP-ribose deacetylase (regulator of RNase III)
MLIHTKGNLLDLAEAGEFDIIVQGCNCFCRMGSGIAREIRARYPAAWEADYETEMGDMFKLGSFTTADTGKFLIVNAYTQYDTSKHGEDVFEYGSFDVILKKLSYAYGKRRIGLPYIGMGLAGGDKQRILAMIEDFASKISAQGGTVTLVEFG